MVRVIKTFQAENTAKIGSHGDSNVIKGTGLSVWTEI